MHSVSTYVHYACYELLRGWHTSLESMLLLLTEWMTYSTLQLAWTNVSSCNKLAVCHTLIEFLALNSFEYGILFFKVHVLLLLAEGMTLSVAEGMTYYLTRVLS